MVYVGETQWDESQQFTVTLVVPGWLVISSQTNSNARTYASLLKIEFSMFFDRVIAVE